MKLNFSLHFRCFMAGVIILFAGMMLALGIPSYEDSVLAEGIEDAFSDFEEDFFFNLVYALFFIFLAYAIGVFLDSFYKPFKKSKSVSKHLEQLMVHFPKNDILLTRFCCSVESKKSLEDMNVYKYMVSFIASTNEALYKEIQNALSKLYIAASLSIASMLLLLTFVVQLSSYDYECDEEFISYVMLVIFFAVCIIVLQLLKRKCRMDLLETIERNYYVLTQCNIVTGSCTVKEDKVNVEIG